MRLEFKVLAVSGTLLMLIYACLAGVMLWLFVWPWNAAFAAVTIGMAAAAVVLRARDALSDANDPGGATSKEVKAQ